MNGYILFSKQDANGTNESEIREKFGERRGNLAQIGFTTVLRYVEGTSHLIFCSEIALEL